MDTQVMTRHNTDDDDEHGYEEEEWFTLDDIVLRDHAAELNPSDEDSEDDTGIISGEVVDSENNPIAFGTQGQGDTLYCISVDSPEKQFLVTESGIPTHNTDEGKEEDALKGEASLIIGSIARLGRAAGVHLVLATQRPDASLIPGETKANLGARVCCGTVDSTASSMILGSGEGTRISPNPKGRIYVKIFSKGDHAQGFFAPDTWLEEYFESQGLHPDGSKKAKEPSRMQKLAEMEELEHSGDLDTKQGNRNQQIISDMRAAEARGEEYVPEDDEAEEIYNEILAGALDDTDDSDDNDMLMAAIEDSEEDDSPPASPQSQEDRPELGGGAKKSKTYRHEDDWDSFMDNIQDLNEEE